MTAPAERPAARPGRVLPFAGAALAGLGLALSFPYPGLWPIALPSLGLLFALWVRAASPRGAARLGFVGGAVFYGVLLRWFAHVLGEFTQLGHGVAWAAVVGSAIVEGALTAVPAAAASRWSRRCGPGAGLLAAALLWCGLEVLRRWFPFPYPWGTLAAAWATAPGAPQIAAIAGSHGLSLLLALGAALIGGLLCLAPRRRAAAGLALWAGLFIGLVMAGRIAQDAALAGTPLRVAVLQASMPESRDETAKLEAYEALTAEAARAGATLVVWPESAVRYRADADAAFRARLEALAKRLGTDLVLGSVTAAPGGGYYNSVVLVRADTGLVPDVQPKRQLVPFGEYLPLRFLFGKVPAIAWEMQEDFRPGGTAVPLRGRTAKIGALVCFEGVFPSLAEDLADAGATVLANTTNDSWFGRTSGPAQHLQHTLLRAAETGRPILRAANTGISVIVDGRGRVLKRLDVGAAGALVADVVPATAAPPGAAVGGAVAGACAIVALAALIAAIFVMKERPSDA